MTYSDRASLPAAGPPEAPARLALLGHDVRAAVSDIIGGLRLVSLDGLDADMRVQLERARASGETLARLLEEGLSMVLGDEDAAEEADRGPDRVQMARLLYDTEMRWGGRAQEKGLEFRLSVAPEVPKVLALDRVALDRVLSNMLSNAMKHADAGWVELDVRLTATGALAISVTDQGPGFSAEAMARLFDYGGRPADTVKPGQGLGLHITRDMTGRLGGSITAGNLAEGGARVTLELPPDRCAAHDPCGHAPAPVPDLTGLNVLVAEDNPTNQTILGQMLARMGATYEIAADGFEALDRLLSNRFDLALIDIEMPHLSGIDVIRWLKAGDTPHPAVPVMAITAHVLRANRDAIYAAGADAILPKPLTGLETFGPAIAGLLSGDDPAPPVPPVNGGPSLGRLVRAAGHEGRELLSRLCADLQTVERDLIAGLTHADAAAVRAATHVLIALSGAVGADALLSLARSLNISAHRGDIATFPRLGAEALVQLDRLIHVVETEKLRHGDA